MSSLKLLELATSCIARKVLSSLSELDTQHTSREPSERVCLFIWQAVAWRTLIG